MAPNTHCTVQYSSLMVKKNSVKSKPKSSSTLIYGCCFFFVVWASSFNPLLGCTRSLGRYWAAIQFFPHPEPSGHMFHGKVDGLDNEGQFMVNGLCFWTTFIDAFFVCCYLREVNIKQADYCLRMQYLLQQIGLCYFMIYIENSALINHSCRFKAN